MTANNHRIYIDDIDLADTKLSPSAKILHAIIKREVMASPRGVKGFTLITNKELAEKMGVCKRTIPNLLKELFRLKRIFKASDTKVVLKKGCRRISSSRYIYLDVKRAGYHQRAMSKRKSSPAYKRAQSNRSMDDALTFAWLFAEKDNEEVERINAVESQPPQPPIEKAGNEKDDLFDEPL